MAHAANNHRVYKTDAGGKVVETVLRDSTARRPQPRAGAALADERPPAAPPLHVAPAALPPRVAAAGMAASPRAGGGTKRRQPPGAEHRSAKRRAAAHQQELSEARKAEEQVAEWLAARRLRAAPAEAPSAADRLAALQARVRERAAA